MAGASSPNTEAVCMYRPNPTTRPSNFCSMERMCTVYQNICFASRGTGNKFYPIRCAVIGRHTLPGCQHITPGSVPMHGVPRLGDELQRPECRAILAARFVKLLRVWHEVALQRPYRCRPGARTE